MPHPIGIIHGRFQVLHNDHLKYLLAGKALCDHLVVGITNPDPTLTTLEPSNPERSQPENNPLTYYERCRMVHAALTESGVAKESFTVVPMPITHPELLRNYIPCDGVCYLTIYDEWGREKEARLAALGLKTHVMWNKPAQEKALAPRKSAPP